MRIRPELRVAPLRGSAPVRGDLSGMQSPFLVLLADPHCGQWLRTLGPKHSVVPLFFADRGRQGQCVAPRRTFQARLPRLGAMPV